ncbi:GD22731 [Drosophila simulans]|uniref:GD22731 n=1 Tax=Drosophila simulans TaxID=7240 RepID=B4Q9P3_DROSI|nr:GD22731 [Drosophila simulans]
MANYSQLRIIIGFCVILAVILDQPFTAEAVVRNACQTAPNNNVWLSSTTTLGIFFYPDTQRCRYMGCSNRKLFLTLEDCEKICNNPRHIKRRNHSKANETSH